MLKEIGKNILTYKDIKCDKDGWVDAKEYAPLPYEIVELKSDTTTANGWFRGDGQWYAATMKENPNILYWKRIVGIFGGGPKDVRRM